MLWFPILTALALSPAVSETDGKETAAPAAEAGGALEQLLAEARALEQEGDELREQGLVAAETGRETTELIAAEVDRYARALALYDQAVALQPGEARLYRQRAWVRAKHDRDGAQRLVSGPSGVLGSTAEFAPEALADADRAVELGPTDLESYLVRARIHAMHFRNTWEIYSGIPDEERALAAFLKPDVASARRSLADYARAAELDPARCEAWAESGEIYFLCFKFDRASEMFTRAHECGATQDPDFLAKLAMVAASPTDFFPAAMLEEYDLSDGEDARADAGAPAPASSGKSAEQSSPPREQG